MKNGGKRKKLFLFLLVLFSVNLLSSKVAVEFPDFMKPRFMQIGGDDLLVLEELTIRVFSLKTYKLKYKFGRKGEGPGEFQFPPRQVIIFPNYKTEKAKVEFIILDLKGKIKKRVFLPFTIDSAGTIVKYNLYQIKNGKLYCLIEDRDNEIWKLHVHDI